MSAHSRPPRRPIGFEVQGPPPRGGQGELDLEPGADEDLSYLAGDWRIFQPKRGHRWSLDDLLTAWVAADQVEPRAGLSLLDLGCGLGSVLMLMAWAYPTALARGVEAQKARAERARRSLRYNGAAERCTVFDADLRDMAAILPLLGEGAADVVTGTPPYFDPAATRPTDNDEAAACRVEMRGGLEVYLDAAERLVKPDGRVVLCYPHSEGARASAAGAERGLSLRERLTVIPRAGKPALILVDVFSKSPGDPIYREITVRDSHGQWSEEFRAVRRRFGMPDQASHASAGG